MNFSSYGPGQSGGSHRSFHVGTHMEGSPTQTMIPDQTMLQSHPNTTLMSQMPLGYHPAPNNGCIPPACDVNGTFAGKSQVSWSYMGSGGGSYEKVQTYVPVGQGMGSFDRQVKGGWRLKPCAAVLLSVIGLAVVAAVVVFVIDTSGKDLVASSASGSSQKEDRKQSSGEASSSSSAKPKNTTLKVLPTNVSKAELVLEKARAQTSRGNSSSFNCDAGFWNWQELWSKDKQKWCCSHHDRGCSSAAKEASVSKAGDALEAKLKLTSRHYDCHAGEESLWNEAKRNWCCDHYTVGCGSGISTWYDCTVTETTRISDWSEKRTAWCCVHAKVGCNVLKATVDMELREGCDAECTVDGLQTTCSGHIQFGALTLEKNQTDSCEKSWKQVQNKCNVCGACSLSGAKCKASLDELSDAGYDCKSEVFSWKLAWSVAKMAYCCAKWGRQGCIGPYHLDKLPPLPPSPSPSPSPPPPSPAEQKKESSKDNKTPTSRNHHDKSKPSSSIDRDSTTSAPKSHHDKDSTAPKAKVKTTSLRPLTPKEKAKMKAEKDFADEAYAWKGEQTPTR
eukprot:TRINITY_DN12528_c0_g7_i1.p1 TRINITY_DN12528_c0_g7~~TRINITY_DN12528_c0_g7_i1.p1  ORF type:complete len:562 (+),score=77.04 TRINITY_DN12528_c0_g7_i1:132-1817(+)